MSYSAQKTRTAVLWQCANHGNGRLSVPRVTCARKQALFNPWGDSKFNDRTVLAIRLKYHWQITSAGRNFRKEVGSLPPYFSSVQKMQYLNWKQTGGRPIQCKVQSKFEFSRIDSETRQPELGYSSPQQDCFRFTRVPLSTLRPAT